MKLFTSIICRLVQIIVIILVPFVLIMSSVRLLLNPFYPQIEYRMPGFPPDSYGFTLQDRLKWAEVSLDYLLNNSDISFLANQKFADGTPIYNERELSHMADVKSLIKSLLNIWLGALIFLVVAILLSLWLKQWPTIRKALSIGGWLTLPLIVAVMVFVATGFTTFFTDFHELFFTGNSWIFLYSDTLIRLFPLRFWEDSFIYVGVLSAVAGILIGWFLRTKRLKAA